MKLMNRSQRPSPVNELPNRLLRLNRELGRERTKSYDTVYATRKGVRFPVCVMRDEDNNFIATTQIGDRVLKSHGPSPSGAFYMLTISMHVYLAQLPTEKRNKLMAVAA